MEWLQPAWMMTTMTVKRQEWWRTRFLKAIFCCRWVFKAVFITFPINCVFCLQFSILKGRDCWVTLTLMCVSPALMFVDVFLMSSVQNLSRPVAEAERGSGQLTTQYIWRCPHGLYSEMSLLLIWWPKPVPETNKSSVLWDTLHGYGLFRVI